MPLKKRILEIHRWLGLGAGLVVFILGITGCILAFELEIRNLTQPFRKVAVQQKPILPPSSLEKIAAKNLVSGKVMGIEYPGPGKAAVASYYDEDHFELLFLNPYSGQVLKHKNMKEDFFRIVLDGHFYLWLPPGIGQPVAASATLVFLILMISGIVLWWPKNKAAKKQRLSIRWNAKWRRRNYDLHNVLGFYMCWIAIFLALTGLVFGFQWFARSVYWVSSGGEKMVEHQHPHSDTMQVASIANMADRLWQVKKRELAPGEGIAVYFAHQTTDPIEIVINHRPGTYYKSDFLHYDQYTGRRISAKGSWEGKFSDAKAADKLVRMNYDIHVGAVFGLPGKMLAFFASLVAASLPVTGFVMWWGRRKKSKKSIPKKSGRLPKRVAIHAE